MKELAVKIGQAAQKLDREILPKTKQPPFESKDGEYLSQRPAELKRIQEQALQAPVFSIRFLGDIDSMRKFRAYTIPHLPWKQRP